MSKGYSPRQRVVWLEEELALVHDMNSECIPSRGDRVVIDNREYEVRLLTWVYDTTYPGSLGGRVTVTAHLARIGR